MSRISWVHLLEQFRRPSEYTESYVALRDEFDVQAATELANEFGYEICQQDDKFFIGPIILMAGKCTSESTVEPVSCGHTIDMVISHRHSCPAQAFRKRDRKKEVQRGTVR